MKQNQKLFESGKFFTGCNYWASHAGTNMWHDWSPEAVEGDFKRLAAANIRVLRMFPLWSDFQPLKMHYTGGGGEKELRLGEEPLPHTDAGRAGVDVRMADRFDWFCDKAGEYGLKLVVGLVTGWMSGRMYMPEAFAGRPLLTDPMVNKWQVKFVRYMVRRFKTKPTIAAWDLGNECNCMGSATADEAYRWADMITNAIKVEDATHPVVSGMHSLDPESAWRPQDQGEILDILCTHPYPIFTPHCDTDPINSMKTILHSTSESVMYAGLGGVPCFIEEAGTLGPMIADEETAADFVRAAMFSAWAHDLLGYVWWCANEQSHLAHTPYDWCAVERELGLFRVDGSPKPVVHEMTAFTEFVDGFAYETLPPRITDGVCILTHEQDRWAAAYGAFILAKQAGVDLTYAWCEDEIPVAKSYLLPSLTGNLSIHRHVLRELLHRVEEGATLYLSLNDSLLSPFTEITGLRVKTRERRVHPVSVELDQGRIEGLWNDFRYLYEPVGAEVLVYDSENNPAFSRFAYGKGQICFAAFPIELMAATKPGMAVNQPLWAFYDAMKLPSPEKVAKSDRADLAVTEHIVDDNTRLLCLMNYAPAENTACVTLDGWQAEALYDYKGGKMTASDNGFTVTLPRNTGCVVKIRNC